MMNEIIIKNTVCRSVVRLADGVVAVNLTLKNGESWTLLDSITVYGAFEITGNYGPSKKIDFNQKLQGE